MGFFSKILQTTIDVAMLPVSVVHDVVTLGGCVNNTKSAVKEQCETIAEHAREAYDALDE